MVRSIRAEESGLRKKDKSKKGTNKHVGEDPSRMVAEINPGKKGGDFSLPFGGNICFPPGIMGKKDVVTCCVVSSSDRYKYQPPLKSDEHMLSEIFLLASNCSRLLKKGPPLTLRLPYYKENLELFSLQLLIKRAEEDDWSVKECQFNDESNIVEFQTDCGGIFAVTSVVRQERFEVPVQGCLYNAKIHHQISVRFPKKATDSDMYCDISIIPLNRYLVAKLRQEYQLDMADLVMASDFYEIRPSSHKAFRRSVTVKLPFPQMETENIDQEDVAIVQMTPEGWQYYDVVVKFVKNAVTFDTRTLSRYCVAVAKPQRKKRLKEAFKHIERENAMIRGDILPFLHIQEKLWTLWIDVVPWSKTGQTIDKRLQQGFKRIKKTQLEFLEEPKPEEEKPIKRSWKSAKTRQPEAEIKPDREELDLLNGCCFDADLTGDMKFTEGDSGKLNMELKFHDRLPENYRRFFIEPQNIEELQGRILTGFLKCYAGDGRGRQCVRTFDFDISPEAVRAYHYIEPEPEPVPEPEEPEVVEEPEELAEVKPETPPLPPPPKEAAPRPNTSSFQRLTKPTKPVKKLFREPKVLTGRSLMTLAREVEQGLTLAIHLDISDSTITGMGFDALANGLSLVDITYRILLLWKRRTSRFKEKQVDMLIGAMVEMGRRDLADLIADKHEQNIEITPECFESPPIE